MARLNYATDLKYFPRVAIKRAPTRQNINMINVDILFKIIKPDICSLWLPLS